MLFEANTIQRFALQAETQFVTEFPNIIDRLSLDIISGTSEYTLPDYIQSIRRVTWLGWKIDPNSHRDFRQYGLSPTAPGRPQTYIYDNIGKQKIKFYPIPQDTISKIQGDDVWGPGVADGVIIEFYRTNDYHEFIAPFIGRKLFKPWVLNHCYLIDGNGFNLKAAKFFQAKWNFLKNLYSETIFDWFNKPRRLVDGSEPVTLYRPPFAHLPIDRFGVSVDDEY